MTQARDLVTQVSAALEDWGTNVTTAFTLTANDPSGTIYQLPQSFISSTTTPTLTDNSTAKTYGADFTVNFNNGQLTVNYVQTSGHVLTCGYSTVLYRDERKMDGIRQGIRRLYPRVYKQGELYIACAFNQYNYDLASTTDVPNASTFPDGIVPDSYVAAIARADLAKVQTRIHTAEYMPYGYIGNASWTPFVNFRRSSKGNWETDTALNTGDTIKLLYSAPCTAPATIDDEIDVPDEYIDMPVWYALGVLLGRKESVRDRSDSYQTQNASNANPPGLQSRTGFVDYMGLYNQTLRDNPMRPMATEARKKLPGYARNVGGRY